ncbi:hypothetical protein DD238_000366 [Peronospora effusa]|uniref:PDZ domain-containing protein n=1 Tax=Peronospora effusa TaxID=542832 RepID=A0A3M6VW77_9STRA|nr:hypothetical protein DD238_000366 [Peronospora effusa]RQM10046.1 hypothetical protein DD237_007786 [Peronospora effusa]
MKTDSSDEPRVTSSAPHHKLQVLLTLHDGERSFGMSLAQKTSTFGAKYTVVSSVFAKSPADRAGVRKGYVVRQINDEPMTGLTVAQVANYFRNVGQARITLEVVESAGPLKTSVGDSMLSVSDGKKIRSSVSGFATVSSGRAIAAPGSALAGLKVVAPKHQIVGPDTKPAEYSLDSEPRDKVSPSNSCTAVKSGHVEPSASAKTARGVSHSRLESQSVAPALQLAKSVQCQSVAQEVAVVTTTVDSAAKSVSKKVSNTSAVEKQSTSSNKSVLTPGLHFIEATRVAAKTPTENAVLQPVSNPSSTTESSLASQVKATGVKPQVFSASGVSSANLKKWPVENVRPAPATVSSVLGAMPRKSATQIPAIYSSKPAVVTAMPPIEVVPRSRDGPAKSKTLTPVRSTTQIATVASVPVPLSPVSRPAPAPTTKTGKKRIRQRTTKSTTGTTSSKGKCKIKKVAKQQQEGDGVDSIVENEGVFDNYTFTSDSDLEESPSKKPACRTAKARRRGVTDRTRHSLTIVRLVDMGFKKEDAEASVKEIGDDLDACMLWIISKIEERQFYEDLNRASIQSERSKHDEEKRVKKLEKEKLARADKFMVVFPTSYMVCAESSASHFKNLLLYSIDQVHGSSYLREVLSELMKLESKSIRWYKEASKSYMVELAARLDAAVETHDVMTCCARALASDVSSPNGCIFLRKVLEEIKALKTALFEMPTNQGGVPHAFLECDEATKFDLEDDGFEVIESNDYFKMVRQDRN